jgi:ferredoxin
MIHWWRIRMSETIKKHPLNVEGKYYVDQNTCTWCATCVDTVPDNFKLEEQTDYEIGAYVRKQPQTPAEEELCEQAVMHCPHEAIHNDGK